MITSTANESVKAVRKLKERKYRESTGTAYVEGIRQVIEAIQQNTAIEKIIVTDNFLASESNGEVGKTVMDCSAPKMIVSDEVFRSFSLKEGPTGLAAVIHQKWMDVSALSAGISGVWVCLWEVADPGNLGTIMRTMDATGARGLILAGNCTDPYDPTAIRASMGGVFNKILVKSSLDELVNVIQAKELKAYGTSHAAGKYYREAAYPQNMLLIMGSERQGIPARLSELCKTMVSLPMKGVCDSLNLAVATSVMLYEILDQHIRKTGKE
jgi:TrmH family RNA methyltransferase